MEEEVSWLGEGFLWGRRKTALIFQNFFSFQRNLGFGYEAIDKKMGSLYLFKYLLEFTSKPGSESLDFPGKRGAVNHTIPRGLFYI